MIVKQGSQYVVKSADGTRELGRYASRKAAEERLAQVEMFKALGAKRGARKG